MPKSLLVVCMAALGVSSIQAQNDSDLQLRAREELRRKMAEMQQQQPLPSKGIPPASKPATRAISNVTAAPATAEPASVAPAATAPGDIDAQTREAMRQKIAEMRNQNRPPAQTQAQDVKNDAEAKAKLEEAKRQQLTATPVAGVGDAKTEKARKKMEAEARAEDARRQKLAAKAQLEADKQTQAEAKARAKQERAQQAEAKKFQKVELFSAQPVSATALKESTPVTATAVTAVGSKEARLAALLDQYRADRITPADYHAQRAKILAEP